MIYKNVLHLSGYNGSFLIRKTRRYNLSKRTLSILTKKTSKINPNYQRYLYRYKESIQNQQDEFHLSNRFETKKRNIFERQQMENRQSKK